MPDDAAPAFRSAWHGFPDPMPAGDTILVVRVAMYTCYNSAGTVRVCRVMPGRTTCALQYLQRAEDLAVNGWDPMRFSNTDLDPCQPGGGVLRNLTEEWRRLWACVRIQRSWRRRSSHSHSPSTCA